MKKSVLLFVLCLLVMTGFVIAQDHPCEAGNESVNGVYIGGVCFNCGSDDGICPMDFGAICEVNDPDCPQIPIYFWSAEDDESTQIDTLFVDLSVGKTIKAVGVNTGLSGEVTIEIYEDDTLSADDSLGTITGTVTNGKLVGTYVIEEENDITGGKDDDGHDGEYELFFEVNGERSNTLITTFDILGGDVIDSCGDYNTNETCIEDLENVGGDVSNLPAPDPVGDCVFGWEGMCVWNSTDCKQETRQITISGTDCIPSDVTCSYTEGAPIGNCDAGDDFYQITYETDDVGCEDWTSNPIPCARRLRLPFFGFFGFIISALMISLIYLFLNKTRFIKQNS